MALGFIVVVVASTTFGPLIVSDPTAQDLQRSRLAPTWWLVSPERSGLLGTDSLGRDVFSRVVYGARVSLSVSTAVVGLALVVGLPLGMLAGYREGVASDLIMRIADAALAIPSLLLAVTIIVALGPSLGSLIVVLTLSRWAPFARVLRATVLRVKQEDYVEAARGVGCPTRRILLVHILPNALNPLIVLASIAFGQVILAEAALSFLGIGVQPPTPSWGGMLGEARDYLQLAPWMAISPGVAITATTLAINLLGDALRDVLDPHQV